MSFTSAAINPLTSPFPPQYPEARLGELTNNWPTVPELPTGSKLSFKMYAPEFITGCPIGTYISIYNYFVGHKGGNNNSFLWANIFHYIELPCSGHPFVQVDLLLNEKPQKLHQTSLLSHRNYISFCPNTENCNHYFRDPMKIYIMISL